MQRETTGLLSNYYLQKKTPFFYKGSQVEGIGGTDLGILSRPAAAAARRQLRPPLVQNDWMLCLERFHVLIKGYACA